MRGRSDIRKLVALDSWILNNDTVTVYNDSDIRFLLDWQFGRLGGFDHKLARVLAHADGGNIIKLYKGFPAKVIAMRAYQIKDGFWQFVQDRDNEVKDHLSKLEDFVNAFND